MKILITNNTLAGRAGTELYVRDLAIALLKRGHAPVAFSTVQGAVAQELRAATVPVVEHLDALSSPPDLIHGHHHLETMMALLRFPGVPAISFCHGWLPWEEMPPKFPRILRYVAVDATCRDRLIFEHGIPEERVRLIYNFVDLDRFKPRGSLPERPRRALVFSNHATENGNLPAIRQACASAHIDLDVVGTGVGNPTDCPEEVLLDYDLVFAKGRAALEALAVGTAVILADAVGVGPMVTTANMKTLRPLNFGIRALQNPINSNSFVKEIARYDACDAMEVSSWVRQVASIEDAVDQLIELYQETLEEHRQTEPAQHATELRAVYNYLHHWVPNLTRQQQVRARHEIVNREREALKLQLDALRPAYDEVAAERNALRCELDKIYRSATIRLRNRLVSIPWIGEKLRLCARWLADTRWTLPRDAPH